MGRPGKYFVETCSCPLSTNSLVGLFRNHTAQVIEIVCYLGLTTWVSAFGGSEKQGISCIQMGLVRNLDRPQVGHKRLLPSSPQYHYRLMEGIVTQSSALFNNQNTSSPTGTASTRKLTIRHLCLCTCRSTLLFRSSSCSSSLLPFLRHPQDPQRCQQISNSLVIHRPLYRFSLSYSSSLPPISSSPSRSSAMPTKLETNLKVSLDALRAFLSDLINPSNQSAS